MQVKMGKKILQCGQNVSAAFVRGELGWLPLAARRDMLRLRFWGKLTLMPDTRVVKRIYNECKDDHDGD